MIISKFTYKFFDVYIIQKEDSIHYQIEYLVVFSARYNTIDEAVSDAKNYLDVYAENCLAKSSDYQPIMDNIEIRSENGSPKWTDIPYK